jgi:hypothetical protein
MSPNIRSFSLSLVMAYLFGVIAYSPVAWAKARQTEEIAKAKPELKAARQRASKNRASEDKTKPPKELQSAGTASSEHGAAALFEPLTRKGIHSNLRPGVKANLIRKYGLSDDSTASASRPPV